MKSLKNNILLSVFFKFSFLLCFFCAHESSLQAESLTGIQKLNFIIDQFTETSDEFKANTSENPENALYEARIRRGNYPCWMFEPRYYQGAPARLHVPSHANMVLENILRQDTADTSLRKAATYRRIYDIENFIPYDNARYYLPAFYFNLDIDSQLEEALNETGITEEQRQSATFKAEKTKEIKDKIELYLKDHPNGEFVGFISFKRLLVVEPYEPKKHDLMPLLLVNKENAYVTGTDIVKPILFEKTSWFSAPKKFVAYENCFDPQPHLPHEEMSVYPEFNQSMEHGPSYHYFEEDFPVATNYRLETNHRINAYQQHLNNIVSMTIIPFPAYILRIVNPQINLAFIPIDYIVCRLNDGSACIGHAVVDALLTKASSAGGQYVQAFVKIPFSGKALLPQLKELLSKKAAINGGLFMVGMAGEGGLTAYHIHRGEYLQAIGTGVSTAIDVSPLLFSFGKETTAIIAAKLGKSKPPVCASKNVTFKQYDYVEPVHPAHIQCTSINTVAPTGFNLTAAEEARVMQKVNLYAPGSENQARSLVQKAYTEAKKHEGKFANYDVDLPNTVVSVIQSSDGVAHIGYSGQKPGGWEKFFDEMPLELKLHLKNVSNTFFMDNIKLIGRRMDNASKILKNIYPNANEHDMIEMAFEEVARPGTYLAAGKIGKAKQLKIDVVGDTVLISKRSWNLLNCAELEALSKWLKGAPGRTLNDAKFIYTIDLRTGNAMPRCQNCKSTVELSNTLVLSEP